MKGPTITIVKSTPDERVFGGYTDIMWTKPSYKKRRIGDGNSFVFTFGHNNALHVFKCLKKEYEVYHDPTSLPIFGDGHTLFIEENYKGTCYTHSKAYETPNCMNPNAFIAGNK